MKTVFQVYQVSLTELQVAALNNPATGGWDSAPEFTAYSNITMGSIGERGADAMVIAAAKLGLFKHVCDIEAGTLEDVFEIGNIGPEDAITRHDRMSSISVGNVVIDPETCNAFFCDCYGWTALMNVTRKTLLANCDTKVRDAVVA